MKKKNESLNVVGKPFRKVDARAKCVGQTKFADDIVLPRMLYCKILRSHVPHAWIKRIDVSKALALPGVFSVITGKDLPIPYGILPVSQDEHALCIDKVRFIGDPVAAVAAIDEDIAFDAMNLIDVEYEPLNTISSIEEGVMIDEPRIHEYGDSGNIHKKYRSSSVKWKMVSQKQIWYAKTFSFTKEILTCLWSNMLRLLIMIQTGRSRYGVRLKRRTTFIGHSRKFLRFRLVTFV